MIQRGHEDNISNININISSRHNNTDNTIILIRTILVRDMTILIITLIIIIIIIII